MPSKEIDRLQKAFARTEVCVLGLPFDRLDERAAIAQLDNAFDRRERCFLSTPNLNFAISALNDTDFRESVFRSDLSVADGMPLIWLSRLTGASLPQRVAGSTIFETIRNRPRVERVSVFFFGGMDNTAELAAGELEKGAAGVRSAGGLNPGMGSVNEMSSDEHIQTVNAADPDFLVVSLGAKKGQSWIIENQDRLNARVISHLGAVVNFVAGTVKRAPLIWQKLGLEWVWRIVEEPSLWKRYFFDGVALVKLVTTCVIPLSLYGRFLSTKFRDSPLTYSIQSAESTTHLTLSGSAYSSNLQYLKAELPQLVLKDQNLVLDLRGLDYVDGCFWALMLRLRIELRGGGKQLRFEGVQDRVACLARLNRVDHVLGI